MCVQFLSRMEPFTPNLFTHMKVLFSGLKQAHEEIFVRTYDDISCGIGIRLINRTETRDVSILFTLIWKTVFAITNLCERLDCVAC